MAITINREFDFMNIPDLTKETSRESIVAIKPQQKGIERIMEVKRHIRDYFSLPMVDLLIAAVPESPGVRRGYMCHILVDRKKYGSQIASLKEAAENYLVGRVHPVRWYAELAVDNAEGATQVRFPTDHNYRDSILNNVEKAMELLLRSRGLKQ